MPIRILPDFKIAENLYVDLHSQATYRHHTLIEEIRLRLKRTGIPSYGYNYTSDFTEKIRKSSYNLYLNPDIINQKVFNFHISKKTAEVLSELNLFELSSETLNQEIVKRLAYTLVDPFYDKFKD